MDDGGKYYFDEEAADKPCRFISKYAHHWEDRFAGQPFTLLKWQRDLVRNLFGWKRRDNGQRRYQELFLLTAKGAGKTPLIAAIGLYMLVADGMAAPHVISMASSFEQANYTFGAAKAYISQSWPLNGNDNPQGLCISQQHKIVVPKTKGQWTIISGKPKGRSGSRPTCLIADECQEWEGPTVQAFNLVSANLFKRTNPLVLIAANAPTSSTSFCHEMYQRAKAIINGTSDDETLLPVIYEAPRTLDWTSEEAARAANPSIPNVITFDQLRPRIALALQSDEAEAEYKRLYLSQQTQSAEKWIDLQQWDKSTGDISGQIKDAVVYVGLDLSQSDDLSAVTYVYVTPTRMYVDAHFWLPRSTAERYDQTAATKYLEWADKGYITLVDSPTISPEVKRQIATAIHERTKGHKVKAIAYDRHKADDCIAHLEAAHHVCVPVGQGWGVSRGCEELDRRLKESGIMIANNPVMRFCAENAERKFDDHGNYWPIKPGANSKGGNGYKGKRSAKIDGITALVTALTEARKHSFPVVKSNVAIYVM